MENSQAEGVPDEMSASDARNRTVFLNAVALTNHMAVLGSRRCDTALVRSGERRGRHALELCPGRIASYELRIDRCKLRLGPPLAFRLVEIDRGPLER